MAISWTSEADAKLVTEIVSATSGTIDWNKVAENMGNGCTVSAVKHRLARLKQRANNPSPKAAVDQSVPTAPTKTKRDKVTRATKLPRKSTKAGRRPVTPDPPLNVFEVDDLATLIWPSMTDQENCLAAISQ